MLYKKCFVTILLFYFVLPILAQYKTDVRLITIEDFIENIYDYIVVDEEEIDDDYINELKNLHDNPLNLNTATHNELKLIPFLSDQQIADILQYVYVHYPMRTLGELMFIKSLNKQERELLMLFCVASDDGVLKSDTFSIKRFIKQSQCKLIAQTNIPCYKKEGYQDVADSILQRSPNKVYKGDPLYRSLRVHLSSSNHLETGLQIEKDPGESDFDYISFYIRLSNISKLRTLIIGDYKVSFGQGLVVNSLISMGKNTMLQSLDNANRGISKHSSLSESKYFRGVATTFDFSPHVNFSSFISYKYIDGTLLSDSTRDITTLKTDGLHRTQLERSKRHNLTDFSAGGNFQIQLLKSRLHLGFTTIYTHLSRPLSPKYGTTSTLYRYYNPSGSDFLACGLSYSFCEKKIRIGGEMATTGKGGLATINSLQYKPNDFNTFTVVQRLYQARYATLYGKSFGENSVPQNESGVYCNWTSTIIPCFTLNTYLDIFYFPYWKYQVNAASRGYDIRCQLTYIPNDKSMWDIRYRLKSKQKNCYVDKDQDSLIIAFFTTQNIRLQNTYVFDDRWSLRSSITGVYLNNPTTDNDFGVCLSETMKYTSSNIKSAISISWFNTNSYQSKIYTYEPSILYNSGMTSVFDNGIKIAGVVSLSLIKNLIANIKCRYIKYFNKNTIGTALEMINSSYCTDFQIQFQYKFSTAR